MKKIILTLTATLSLLTASDYQRYKCIPHQAIMLDVHLAPGKETYRIVDVSPDKIDIMLGYSGTFDRATNDSQMEVRYYKSDIEGVEVVWLPKQKSLSVNYKKYLFSVHYKCSKMDVERTKR